MRVYALIILLPGVFGRKVASNNKELPFCWFQTESSWRVEDGDTVYIPGSSLLRCGVPIPDLDVELLLHIKGSLTKQQTQCSVKRRTLTPVFDPRSLSTRDFILFYFFYADSLTVQARGLLR